MKSMKYIRDVVAPQLIARHDFSLMGMATISEQKKIRKALTKVIEASNGLRLKVKEVVIDHVFVEYEAICYSHEHGVNVLESHGTFIFTTADMEHIQRLLVEGFKSEITSPWVEVAAEFHDIVSQVMKTRSVDSQELATALVLRDVYVDDLLITFEAVDFEIDLDEPSGDNDFNLREHDRE